MISYLYLSQDFKKANHVENLLESNNISFYKDANQEFLKNEIFKEVDEQSINHLDDIVKPVNGMHGLIDSLYEKECKIAIATTDKTARADLAADFLGISDRVNMVVGEDMVANCKPHPDMADLILKKLSVDKENAVIVGDAITDIEMGFNAGLKASIGVCSGLTSENGLLEKTKYVIKDISMIKVMS